MILILYKTTTKNKNYFINVNQKIILTLCEATTKKQKTILSMSTRKGDFENRLLISKENYY